jgi:hypothetical protein
MCANLFMVCRQWAAVISPISRMISAYYVTVRYTSEQRVCLLHDNYGKYGSARKCQWKCRRKYADDRVSSRQTIHKVVNKLISTGLDKQETKTQAPSAYLARKILMIQQPDLNIHLEYHWNVQLKRLTPWSESANELYRPSDRRLSAKWLPTSADRECHMVNVTDPYGRIICFLDRSRYFSIK